MTATPIPAPTPRNTLSGVWKVVKFLFQTGLIAGLILAVVTCSNERQNARLATIQTYNLSRIAAFRDSGAELDKKVATFADAASERRSLSESRLAFRGALVDHAAKTMAMEDAFGKAAIDAYSSDLKALQNAIEGTNDQTTSGPIITAMSRVVVTRKKLAENASKKAAG